MKEWLDLLQNKWGSYLFSADLILEHLPSLKVCLNEDLSTQSAPLFLKTRIYLESLSEEDYLELLEAYVFFNGGKRVRPLLMLATYSAIKHIPLTQIFKILKSIDFSSEEKLYSTVKNQEEQEISQIFHLFSALECIHTYSLVHDDLPSMDDDAFRRGSPTVHTFTNEAMAILIGDTLGSRAQMLILKEKNWNPYYQKAAQFIVDKSSSRGMILGQVLDLKKSLKDEKNIDLEKAFERVKKIHSKKTGDMIEASVMAPAFLLNTSPEIMNALQEFSKNLGLAFQIKDDILDVEADENLLGKTKGKDQKNGKWSSVNIIGLESSKSFLQQLHNEGFVLLNQLEKIGLYTEPLIRMYKMLVDRQY